MESSHYGRFVAILEELLALREQDPTFEPGHPVSAAIVRTVEGDPPSGPFITDATTAAVSDLFNVINDLLLQMLCRYFALGRETEGQSALMNAAVETMFRAIKPLGLLLATLPVGDEHPGLTAGRTSSSPIAPTSFFRIGAPMDPLRGALRTGLVVRERDRRSDGTRAELAEVATFLQKTAAALTTHIELV